MFVDAVREGRLGLLGALFPHLGVEHARRGVFGGLLGLVEGGLGGGELELEVCKGGEGALGVGLGGGDGVGDAEGEGRGAGHRGVLGGEGREAEGDGEETGEVGGEPRRTLFPDGGVVGGGGVRLETVDEDEELDQAVYGARREEGGVRGTGAEGLARA